MEGEKKKGHHRDQFWYAIPYTFRSEMWNAIPIPISQNSINYRIRNADLEISIIAKTKCRS